ncbi:MAG TPA: Uma2 family endonuclease [Candidatus Dormibacteraeota bacterium]|nr:Uma2 family endonuclease [Candidatus Dormibacteraeota bacterium]
MPTVVAERTLHRFNVAEYAAMIRHGILTDRDRVELIAGEIVEMPPSNPPHAGSVTFLHCFFCTALGRTATVASQQTLEIPPHAMLQPDLMLLAWRDDFYRARRIRPQDVLLVVEVADASLHYDRTTKVRLYAHAGVPECWVVDLSGKAVELHGEPRDDRYTGVRVARGNDLIAPAAFPDCRTSVKEILGAC